MRVHELAKELGLESKELIAQINQLGGNAKSHMSLVEEEIARKLRETVSRKAAPPPPTPAKVEPKPVPSAQEKPKVKIEAAAFHKPVAPAASRPVVSEPKPAPAAVTPKPAAPVVAPKTAPAPAPKAAPVPKPVVQEVQAKTKEEPVVTAAIAATAVSPALKVAKLHFPITVGDLAKNFMVKIPELIKCLMGMGIFANVNQLLNEEIVLHVGRELGVTVEKLPAEEEIIEKQAKAEDPKQLKPCPPVVTMMGHVDHGKTSLLDAIRKTNVAAKEKGFITQHIGAYSVDIPGKGHVTFLDTPGHEAFTAMRTRGVNVTDVVVLVVAADDGVMPQTIEAIDHAREAGCPIVVAINKIDLPGADPARVMKGLQKAGLMPEEWGGKTICAKVSAKTGQGLENLLELLLLEAEILELKANPECPASGVVVESHLSKGSGPIATVIVESGTLKIGDIVVCGPHTGRVRSLRNDKGKTLKEVPPAFPAEVTGLNGIPEAGETFCVVEDEKTARKITERRVLQEREKMMRGATKHLSLEELYHRISEGNFKELKIIIKADVQGSVEALSQSLEKIASDQCQVRVIHGGVGGINESDVMLAAASDAIILGFHVKPDPKSQKIAEAEGVDIRFYNIIYEVVDDVKKAMEGLLEPTYKEVIEGRAQIQKIFKSTKVGTIGGAMVTKGRILRANPVRILRNQIVLFDGKLGALKRFKDDVREVAQGYECGISLHGFDDLAEGDMIESYRLDKIAGKLES